MELAQLAQKRIRLRGEARRWEKRIKQIQSRLEEIDKLEKWLHQFADGSKAPSAAALQSKESSSSTSPDFHEMNIQY